MQVKQKKQIDEAHLWRLRASLMEFFTTRQLLLAGRGEEASGSSMLGSLWGKETTRVPIRACTLSSQNCSGLQRRHYLCSWGINGWNGLSLWSKWGLMVERQNVKMLLFIAWLSVNRNESRQETTLATLGASACGQESEDGGYGSLNVESSLDTVCSKKKTNKPKKKNSISITISSLNDSYCKCRSICHQV